MVLLWWATGSEVFPGRRCELISVIPGRKLLVRKDAMLNRSSFRLMIGRADLTTAFTGSGFPGLSIPLRLFQYLVTGYIGCWMKRRVAIGILLGNL